MEFVWDVRRLMSRTRTASALRADPAAVELLPLQMVQRDAIATGLAAYRAEGRERSRRLIAYAQLLCEIVRRTGEPETLAKAASAAERAGQEAEGELLAAARLEQAAAARLGAELFGDDEAARAAAELLDAADAAAGFRPVQAGRRLAMRAAAAAVEALRAADLDQAMAAAAALDAAVERLDEDARSDERAKAEAAAARCERADFLIGLGVRLKDRTLIERAEEDLTQLASRLDPHYLPLTWTRAETLRGAALARLGELSGDANALAEAVRVLAKAAENADFDYSPLDRGRTSHALALALAALAEATEDPGFYDHAMAAFDQALAALDGQPSLAIRPLIVHDRAACLASAAELTSDAAALARAELSFRNEIAACDAANDPVAWALAQLALARVYVAEARLLGGEPPPEHAPMALTEAIDVFLERGCKSLAETAQDLLEQLCAAGR